tara:strand:- start:29572 stop:29754 length:183 start_codon:yes stop_codon:yes gene_type:complete
MEDYWQLNIIVIPGVIYLFRIYILENAKSKRIINLKDLDNEKIEAIGNYERKSKFWYREK